MLSLSDRRRPFAVCTVVQATGSVPGKLGATMLVTPDGSTRGTVGGAGLEEKVRARALDALRGDAKGGLVHFDLAHWKPGGLDSVCGGSVDVSVLVHRPLPHLLLYGGGHCGKALADLAVPLDWDVTVVDSRAEFANRDRFPEAVDVHAGDPAAWTRDADLAAYTHAYLLGHSHDEDTRILTEMLPRFEGHVGVIGSRSKKQSMFERVRAAGVDARRLDRVQIPIGVPVGAESPEEIAVSVAAEIISTLKSSPVPVPEART